MNSNTPNSPDERSHGSEGDQRGHSEHDERSNPYFARQQAAAEPDLDANEPVLRSNEIKRLNRKALVFLALIAGLLLLAIFWLANQGSGDSVAEKPRTETVVAPALPQNMTAPVETAPIALTPQPTLPPLPPMPEDDVDNSVSVPERPRAPTLLERRILAEQSGVNIAGDGGAPVPGQVGGQAVAPKDEEITLAKPLSNPDGLLVRGTYIRCVLETRILSDFGGYTSCIVTEPVYSINGHNLLLPKGSKMLGQYGSGEPTTRRLQVVWDRVTTPTGLDVTLVGPGIDTLGSAGHPGQYNAHWGNKIASALFISLLSDAFKYAAAEYGPETTTIGLGSGIVTQQPFESNTARSMQQLAEQAVEKSGRRPATLTINQGTVLNVYVAKDVDFSAVLPK
ncbi:TrbI/VirB10 family protein [Xanthomonas campestris pv. raphani]|uniref:TrbI/VirB10 family protein n=1 Tax=Xanthomonas campestris TaxID=339 RepID=UPI002B227FDC|nr:TrbI/VirB10 family protein [Xanthomonas campestris]MEA9749846.1 TrbI/VirB10 family protein [Xanthomonas campestris pv. raphani]MEA9810418.1 TrbI/VirB10 family protein [Xanthomonas campestris pv. raphani]